MARRSAALAVAVGMCAFVLAGQTGTGKAAASEAAPQCELLATSTAFERDGTVACVGQSAKVTGPGQVEHSAISVWRTSNGGRSWQRARAAGLPGAHNSNGYDGIYQLEVARTEKPRTLYLVLGQMKLYVSSDFGDTWVAPLQGYAEGMNTGSVTPLPPGGAASGDLALANPLRGVCDGKYGLPLDSVLVFTPAAVVGIPAQGSACSFDFHFLVPEQWPDEPAYVLSLSGDGAGVAEVWRCDERLACNTRISRAPASGLLDGSWIGPSLGGKRSLYYAARLKPHIRAYGSLDGGATWRELTGLNRWITTRTEHVALLPTHGRQVFARISTAVGGRNWIGAALKPSVDVIAVSEDGGLHWREVTKTPGFNARADQLALSGDGRGLWGTQNRLLTLAAVLNASGQTVHSGVWCSVDRGKTWTRLCRS